MTHGRFNRLQLRTISASFTNTQQQIAEMILALFFLHLINENKHNTVTDKINNKINIYLPSSTNKQWVLERSVVSGIFLQKLLKSENPSSSYNQ